MRARRVGKPEPRLDAPIADVADPALSVTAGAYAVVSESTRQSARRRIGQRRVKRGNISLGLQPGQLNVVPKP